MGYTKEMIKTRYDVCVAKKNTGEDFFGPLLNVLNDLPEKIWGYEEFGKDGVVIIGGDLERIEREEVRRRLPYFKKILFLKGLDKDAFQEDPNLVQRVMAYGGSLPGWKWTLVAGDWKEIYQECVNDTEALSRLGFVKVNAP